MSEEGGGRENEGERDEGGRATSMRKEVGGRMKERGMREGEQPACRGSCLSQCVPYYTPDHFTDVPETGLLLSRRVHQTHKKPPFSGHRAQGMHGQLRSYPTPGGRGEEGRGGEGKGGEGRGWGGRQHLQAKSNCTFHLP